MDTMKPPCELAVRDFLPSLRAAIVRELSETYHMKQTDIAHALGITQASVSQYLNVERGKEGRFKSLAEFDETVEQIAHAIISPDSSKLAILKSICLLCTTLRKSEQFCHEHQEILNISNCDICKSLD
jgi:predicted transcriptional regulator